jgi:alpha-D-xyloside xylohydrolase
MKFTDGCWRDKAGVTFSHAVETVPGSIGLKGDKKDTLRALCTSKHTKHRGDTLNRTTITIESYSPAKDVIATKASHFTAVNRAHKQVVVHQSENVAADIKFDQSAASIQSGGLKADLNTEAANFKISYTGTTDNEETQLLTEALDVSWIQAKSDLYEGMKATHSFVQPMDTEDTVKIRSHMSVLLSLAPGEYVYGLGERFGPFIKNGQSIDTWNEDGGTSSGIAYKNVPFYMTNKGYGVFFNHSEAVSFEVQSEKMSGVQASVEGESITWYVIYGPTPADILDKYTALLGRPGLPPQWTFGLWLSTSFVTDYDEKTVTSFLDGMKDRTIPLSVFHFDCFWMKPFRWCDFEFDADFFPDPKAFLNNLHKRGLKVCVWINSWIAQESGIFQEADENGYLVKRLDGTSFQSDDWQAGKGVVDFTNPDACKWFQSKLEHLLDLGVDTFKTDFGERIVWKDVKYFDGSDPVQMHNQYTHLYNKCVWEVLEKKRGKGEACLFARSATAGGQQYPVHWGGDSDTSWFSMAETLRAGLSLAVSGFGFWSHDIAGFKTGSGNDFTNPVGAIYKRWVQFGLLSSHSRLHGSSSYRVPWIIDDEACLVLEKFVKLKMRLMPYIWKESVNAHKTGAPLLRPMFMEFPEDRSVWPLDQQYMLGPSLLVAPIFNDTGDVEYYIPKGTWVGLLDGKKRVGPQWVKEKHDFLSMPILVRENHIVILGSEDSKPDYDYTKDFTVVVGSKDTEATTTIVDAAGKECLKISAANGSIQVDNAASEWKVQIIGEEEKAANGNKFDF